MDPLHLLSRAKALLQQRAAGSALVILPLVLAAPAAADSLFVLGDANVSGALSGGNAFGHANSALLSAAQTVELNGDTIPVDTPGSYLTAGLAAKASFDAATATIVFDWSGTFETGSTLNTTDSLLLSDSIFPKTMPDDAGSIAWTIYVSVNDSSYQQLVYQTVSSSDSGDAFFLPVTQAGDAAYWDVQLVMDWTFPMTESGNVISADPTVADAQLDGSSLIDLTIVPGAGSSSPPPDAAPLPTAFWPGASLLTLLAAGAFVRNVCPRRGV